MKQGTFSKSIAVIASFVLICTAAFAAEHNVDTDFSVSGYVTWDLSGYDQRLHRVIVLPDKGILAGGYQFGSGNTDLLFVKYDQYGNPFPGFNGNNGGFTYDYGFSEKLVDFKVVSSGSIFALLEFASYDYMLVRFSGNGSPDVNFGTGGAEVLDFGGTLDHPKALGVQSTGKIILAGYVELPLGDRAGLARYNANGGIDSTFGAAGKTKAGFTGYSERAMAMLILSDDKILVAGEIVNPGNNTDFFLARYTANGQPDMTFGVNGSVSLDLSGNADHVHAMALQGNKIILAGTVDGPDGSKDLALARFNDNGGLDTTFGTGGWTTNAFAGGALGNPNEEINDIVIQPDQKILITGYTTNFLTKANILLGRYTVDGVPDSTFSGTGFATLDIENDQDYGNAIALQPDGKIVVAGSAKTNSGPDALVVRFMGSSDNIDPTVCTGALFCDQFDNVLFGPFWNKIKPTWTESNGKFTGAPSGKTAFTLAESGWVNTNVYSIRTAMQSSGGVKNTVWLYGWYADNKNYIELLMKEDADKWLVKHHSNGVIVSKAKAKTNILPNQMYSVKVVFDGSTVKVYVDNFSTPLITMQVNSTVEQGTVGFQAKNTTGLVEYIRVD